MGPLKPFLYKSFVYEMRNLAKKLATLRAEREALEKLKQELAEEQEKARRESLRTGVRPLANPRD
jgi:hypothetical protein